MAEPIEQTSTQRTLSVPQAAGLGLVVLAALAWPLATLTWGGASFGWNPVELLRVVQVTAALLAICLIPGLALVLTLWPASSLGWPERLALGWGVGVGVPALVLMAAHLVRLPWPSWMTVVYVVAGVALLGFRLARERRHAAERDAETRPALLYALLIGLTLLAVLARAYTIRGLVVGPNVDSYHHTLIAELLVSNQGLFSNWEPYAPLSTFTYHYGFHALVAWAFHITGVPIVLLVPLVGQIMNGAMVPMLFALTTFLTRRPTTGVWAALLVGFVNMQPAFYVFWGRGPFVASHSLLVAVLICWMAALEAERLQPRILALAVITSAALAHTHYQSTIFAALFVLTYLLVAMLRATSVHQVRDLTLRTILIGAGALVLALPWLVTTLNGHLVRNVTYNSDLQSGETFGGLAVLPIAPLFVHPLILLLAVIGVLAAIRLRLWRVALLACWALVGMLAAFPYLAGLPGTGMIETSVAPMVLYLSLVPLAGFTLGGLQLVAERLAGRFGFGALPVRLAAAAMIVVVSIGGIGWQRDLVPPYDRMVTSADLAAMEWIRASTPKDARFLVHSHPIYGGTMIVGTDAGWWIPLLAGRQTNVPPLPYGSERADDPAYADRVNALAVTLRRKPLTDGRGRGIDLSLPEAQDALRSAGIRYVYIGAQPLEGPSTIAVVDRIDPDKLHDNPAFRLVYDRNGVQIYEFLAPAP